MTRSSQNIIACTGEALFEIRVSVSPVFCWLYFQEKTPHNFEDLVKHVASLPSTHIAVSGRNCAMIHDEIDDVLMELGKSEITTTWHEEPDDEAAWDFINLDFNDNRAACRIVAVIGRDLGQQLAKLSDLVQLCKTALKSE